ncbi:MAG: polysaccharide biosynthesis/export family protein [Phycisphaerae bacterium]
MTKPSHLRIVALIGMIGLFISTGCSWDDWKTGRGRFLNPAQPIDAPEDMIPLPIQNSVGPIDETRELIPNATFPTTDDIQYSDEDYLLAPADVIEVRILDLYEEGAEALLPRTISDSGYIDLPLVGKRILAEGKNTEELKEAIKDVYRPDVLRNPVVSVQLLTRRRQFFSILGAVERPGPGDFVRKDLRLLEAISMSGGLTQLNIPYIYVFRSRPAVKQSQRDTGGQKPATTQEMDKALQELRGGSDTTTEPATEPVSPAELLRMGNSGGTTTAAGGVDPDLQKAVKGTSKWYWSNGEYKKVPQDGSVPTGTQPAVATKDPFGWQEDTDAINTRIIAINVDKLMSGDEMSNIVIRDKDVIRVPHHEVGEFYVQGEVQRPGSYQITGRKVTIKQAIAAAGNLGPLAWPENCLLIRRIGEDQEVLVPLDVEAIYRGETPDIFLKPNDIVAVGSSWNAPFLAVMRNAFRMTYGFGFIYDRNFGEPQLGDLTSKRFKQW